VSVSIAANRNEKTASLEAVLFVCFVTYGFMVWIWLGLERGVTDRKSEMILLRDWLVLVWVDGGYSDRRMEIVLSLIVVIVGQGRPGFRSVFFKSQLFIMQSETVCRSRGMAASPSILDEFANVRVQIGVLLLLLGKNFGLRRSGSSTNGLTTRSHDPLLREDTSDRTCATLNGHP
jgi:hypothetical protein